MTTRNFSRARHRADVRPTTFLSDVHFGAAARRGTVGVATAGLAFGLMAPAASANEQAPSGGQDTGAVATSSGGSDSGGSGGGTYTVSAGDTVAEIAASQGSSVSAIIDANGLNSQALIFPGDELTIPGGSGGSDSGGESASDGDVQNASSGEGSGGAEITQASSNSNAILDIARQYVGTPYVWGGADPSGFDCSGFTQYVFAQAGIDLPRTTDAQRNAGQVVSEAEAQPGDLVWAPGHVGIYTGDGQHIAARSPGTALHESQIWMDNPTFIRVA